MGRKDGGSRLHGNTGINGLLRIHVLRQDMLHVLHNGAFRRNVRHKDAAAAPDFEQSHQPERGNGLTQCIAPYIHGFGNFTFGRKLVPHLHVLGADFGHKLFRDKLTALNRLDLKKHALSSSGCHDI